MNEQALFCDGTGAYVIPPQPDANEAITLRFRTAKDDVDAVRLLTRDAKYDLQKVYTKGEFDFYEVNWSDGKCVISDIALRYKKERRSVITTDTVSQTR